MPQILRRFESLVNRDQHPPRNNDTNNNNNNTNDVSYNNNPEMRQRSSLMAILVGLFCALGGFLYGYDTGIINSLLSMNYVKSTFASNKESFTALETAIITAILSLGTFVGALLAPLTSDTVGRRMTIILVTSIVFPLGTVLQIAAHETILLCVGRFISGIAVGIISAVVPVYQSEASPKWIRGSVVSTYQWAITWGLLVSSAVSQGTHSIDDSRSYRIPIALQLIWTYILAVGMFLLPESPRYYVKKNLLDKALNSLSTLRRVPATNGDLIEELVEIKAQHDYEASFGKAKLIDCFRSSPSRHSQLLRMLTGMGLQCIQQSTGINFIFYYGVTFFVKSGLQHSYIMSLVTYTVNVVATIPGIIAIEVIGRRKLLLIGATGMSLSNFIIAIVGVTTDSKVANQVMIAFVCVFIAFFASTWGPIVWVICSEVYSLDIRGKAVSITASMNWIVNFAFAFITPYLVDTGGGRNTSMGTKIFFIWGSCCFAGLVFSYLCVYETKGLMLEEVDEMYRCCKRASKSSAYKSKIHEQYLNNELGYLNNNDPDLNNPDEIDDKDYSSSSNNQTELKTIDLNSQNSSSSPTNTTFPNTNTINNNNVNIAPFIPDLDFTRLSTNSTTNNNNNNHNNNNTDNNIYHVNYDNRSPPSLDSASLYSDSDEEDRYGFGDHEDADDNDDDDDDEDDEDDDEDDDDHGGKYNYINEADLATFINDLNNAKDMNNGSGSGSGSGAGSVTGAARHLPGEGSTSSTTTTTMKRGSMSSSTKTAHSSSTSQPTSSTKMAFTFNNTPIDIVDNKNTHFNNASGGESLGSTPLTDYNDILTGLRLSSTQHNNNGIQDKIQLEEDPGDLNDSSSSSLE